MRSKHFFILLVIILAIGAGILALQNAEPSIKVNTEFCSSGQGVLAESPDGEQIIVCEDGKAIQSTRVPWSLKTTGLPVLIGLGLLLLAGSIYIKRFAPKAN